MKLELKHIAPYLPHGLKWLDKVGNKHNTSWMSSKRICLIDTNSYGGEQVKFLIKDIHKYAKPILYTLELTKEIEHNGKKFIPAERLKNGKNDFSVQFAPSGSMHNTTPYWAYQKLIEWKYDIFGLIENGLAIDKNTLK